jgi:uncharacterized Tic20 family protein
MPLSPSDERLWSMLGHLSFFVFALLAPLIIMLTAGERSAYVRDQSVEALNFHITLLIAAIACFALVFFVIGIFLLIALWIAGAVFAIIAAVESYQGRPYRYPISLRLIT